MPYTFKPVTPGRWNDFETLFGARGACGGCWCMTWRATRVEFDRNKGEGNRRAIKKIIERGPAPGVLAYDGKQPVGWCSVAPRTEFVRLQSSRTMKPIDDTPVWSITCLFVAKEHRNRGLSVALIRAAAELARKQGATVVEAYPYDPGRDLPPPFVWTGLLNAYLAAGFEIVKRPSKTRAIVRREA